MFLTIGMPRPLTDPPTAPKPTDQGRAGANQQVGFHRTDVKTPGTSEKKSRLDCRTRGQMRSAIQVKPCPQTSGSRTQHAPRVRSGISEWTKSVMPRIGEGELRTHIMFKRIARSKATLLANVVTQNV